jgi:hypothetical protein
MALSKAMKAYQWHLVWPAGGVKCNGINNGGKAISMKAMISENGNME